MPLTLECKLYNLSYQYDTLTIYPKFETYEKKTSETGRRFLTLSREAKEENLCLTEISESKLSFEKYIQNDDDHDLYHRDRFDGDHSHIKFRSMLTRTQLTEIINIFVKHGFLSEPERTDFLVAFDNRYAEKRAELDAELKGEKYADTRNIINLIGRCKDNDILVNLHQHLLTREFDYLRACTGCIKTTFWQGTSRNGEVTDSSKSWAMIEKAFTLQMAHNIKINCSVFSPTLAAAQAKQLRDSHSFFSIKRNTKSWCRTTSASFDAFQDHDVATFDNKYTSHFR